MSEQAKCPKCESVIRPAVDGGDYPDHYDAEVGMWRVGGFACDAMLFCLRRQLATERAAREQAERERDEAQAACAEYVQLPSVVGDLCERRELQPCFFASEGDCGNWETCDKQCPVATLRRMAGFTYQNENGDLGPTPSKPNPGQAILDRVKELETFVRRIDGGPIPDVGGNTPSLMVEWVQSIRAAARKMLKGEGE